MYNMKDDFQWFTENRESIIKDHIGQRVVIKDKQVKGYYDTDQEAIEAMKPVPLGEYIVQRCLTEDDDTEYYYTGRYSFD